MQILWNRLDGLWVGAWARHFQRPGAVRNWADAWAAEFVKAELGSAEVALGLSRVSELPISDAKFGTLTVQQFIAWCRPVPEQLDDESAYEEAIKQIMRRRNPVVVDGQRVTMDKWTEPAIYWAAVALGHDLTSATGYQFIKGRWKRALDYARKHPKGPVPVFREALPPPGKCSMTPDDQKAAMAKIMATLGKPPIAGATRGSKLSLSKGNDLDLAAMKRATQELLDARLQRDAEQNEREKPISRGKAVA